MAEFNLDSLPSNSKSEGRPKLATTRQQKKSSDKSPTRMKAVVSANKLANGGKKTFSQKFMSLIIPEDITDIKKYIRDDVIIPGIKGLLLDTMAMIFFNETYTGKRGRIFNFEKKSYSSMYGGKSYNSSSRSERQKSNSYVNDDRNRIDYRDVVLTDRADAEAVIEQLQMSIEKYGQVSIGDLYSLIDITPKHTDFDWGWTDPRCIGLRRVSNGYLINVDDARFLE